uniref:Uncharacterized protein n=1 Tax=Rhizophagus irregularis (strain DAOM 181602 / DAOM 197198 / MUCL 43194) TaxID=747089 RepID=U9SVB7_RHIID
MPNVVIITQAVNAGRITAANAEPPIGKINTVVANWTFKCLIPLPVISLIALLYTLSGNIKTIRYAIFI